MNGSKLKITIAGLAVALSLVGCAMQPAFEDANVVSQIRAGRTTKADVQNMLGQPADEVTLPGAGNMWTYRDIQPGGLRLGADPTRIHTLTITFNNDGVVQSLNSGRQTMGDEPIWNKWLDPKNAGPKVEITPLTP
jgi:outer membrane protein assembly factor BamE (lipoprotein component of BamABCDE complex)